MIKLSFFLLITLKKKENEYKDRHQSYKIIILKPQRMHTRMFPITGAKSSLLLSNINSYSPTRIWWGNRHDVETPGEWLQSDLNIIKKYWWMKWTYILYNIISGMRSCHLYLHACGSKRPTHLHYTTISRPHMCFLLLILYSLGEVQLCEYLTQNFSWDRYQIPKSSACSHVMSVSQGHL